MIDTFGSRNLEKYESRFLNDKKNEKLRTVSHSNKLFSLSRLYLSNRGHMSIHVPTMVIASSNRLGTRGSSILPSAMALLRSEALALTSL